MPKTSDRAKRSGSDPIIIGSSKIATDSNNDISIVDTSGNAKKVIASEVHLGTGSDKVILKRSSSDGKLQLQTTDGSSTSNSEVSGDSGGAGGVTVQEEGSALSTTATTPNFVGSSVTASGSGETKTITISAGTGGTTTVYANINAMTASSPSAGDQALVTANAGLYIYNGGGWYKIATVNTSPTISSPSSGASYSLNTDGSTATAIELVGADVDEGTTLQNSYAVTTGSLTNGGGTTATITSSATSNGTYTALAPSTNTTNRFFKITGTSNSSFAGSFTLTFSMSDGISAATTVQNFSLSFFTAMKVPSGTTMLLGLSFDNNGLGKSGSWNTPTQLGNGISNFYSSGGYHTSMNGHAGYANPPSGGTSHGYRISEIVNGNALKGKTWIIWYKGSSSQIISGQHNSVGVPILCDQGNAWAHSGIDQGKIAFNSGNWSGNQGQRGTTNVCDDQWHMLTWIFSDGTHARLSNNSIGMWVDGSFETSFVPYAYGNHNAYMKLDELFMTYSSGWKQPERVDSFQIFDNELTDAQISEIYGS